MDVKQASGDNNYKEIEKYEVLNVTEEKIISNQKHTDCDEETQLETIERETKIKERIANCRKVIEALKLELCEEKAKLQEESKSSEVLDSSLKNNPGTCVNNIASLNNFDKDAFLQSDANLLSASVDSKLSCDESLMEYEKQLQKYQNTLNMAQNEKKNAIRKQMLTKAYKLKLLEVENQCNIELLRVKQSLQCLEPLQMIVNKWKSSDNITTYNLNSYELIPRYPELNPILSTNVDIFTDDEKSKFVAAKEDA